MAIGDLLQTMSTLMETCRKHVSQATRRLLSQQSLSKLGSSTPGRRRLGGSTVGFLSRRTSFIPFLGDRRVADEKKGREEEEGEEDGVWKRTILMGEKCQPLNFSGAIHYDSSGRQLSRPRTPLRTPMTSFVFHDEVEEEGGEDEAVCEHAFSI